MPRSAARVALLLACALCLAALAPGSAAAATIVAPGPVTAIELGDDLSCQVSWVNDVDYEFFPPDTTPGDCGTFLAVGDTLYAPDFGAHDSSATAGLGDYVPFTPVSQTGVLGAGTAADPYRVRTVVDAPGAGLRLVEETSYVVGTTTLRVETSVENLDPINAKSAILYHAGDCYASGSDIGHGFTRPEIRSAGCSQSPDNVPAGRTIQMSPLSSGSHWYEAYYRQVWEQIATKTPFPDTCRCGEHVDNGVGLSWSLDIRPGGREPRTLEVSFTETQQPAPGADADGDALPDAWETGAAPSGDFQNLASLGADPNRKDVFVHADWMAGCQPPAGWERDAIDVFAAHGIALHVDSGPDSLNAGGSRWGALSRAGELPYQPSTTVWGASYDALKDAHFVASNRRRAFHYMAFVNQIVSSSGTNSSGGKSRGDAGEADFVVATCSGTLPGSVDRTRWTTVTFVHELGHNLGLQHGGSDGVNHKPSYYSIMNYSWALVGGTRRPGALRNEPDYSEEVRPSIDERHVDERTPYARPIAWYCPGGDRLYQSGRGPRPVDWDCDGILGEDPYALDLNGSGGEPELLTGYHDWAPFALRFTGNGVIGDLDLPPRPDPPVEPELTAEEVAQAAVDVARSEREARRQLVVTASRRRLRARRATTVRIRVHAGRRRVRGARIRVRGARVLEGRGTPTSRSGRVTLTLRPARRGDVRIVALRRGFERGGIVVPVRRRR